MADSFQSEVPKARINLKLDLHTGGATKKTELPLKLLIAGDFSHGQETAPLSERKKINVNKNNFNSALSEYFPKVNLTIKNTLANDGSEENILALEPEALEKADNEGLDATLHWLQTRPGADSTKGKWLLRLLMARVAEQKGKNELALHLLGELDSAAQCITLTQWTPALLFEVKSRRLRLLRMKATRSETDKSRLQPEMDLLLSGLVALDPASSAVLCG